MPVAKSFPGGSFLRLSVAVLSAILAIGVAPFPAVAQTPPPPSPTLTQMTATPAFEGNFKYGEWLPIDVELSNSGPDVQADLRVPVQGAGGTIYFSQPVEMPAGAHKLLSLYVLPNNFTRQLNVELVSGEALLASQRVDVHPNPNVNYLVGLIAPNRSALSLIDNTTLPGMKRTKILIDLPLEQIPERFEGLRSLDLLVLNDVDTSRLTPSQALALQTWVNRGGRLVIGGGASGPLTVSGLPESLFPGKMASTSEVQSLPALEDFSSPDDPIRVPGPFVLANLETSSGQTLAGDGSGTLVHEWTLGSGFVDFVALNLAASPFDAWSGTTAFWEKLISPGAAYPEYLPTDISARQQFASNMPYALTNLPVLDLPSVKGLALMLALYILLVGPVNYLVLQRMKRLHLAWITIPAITVIFSAASFGLGYALHGTDVFINKISVIQLDASGSAHYDSFIGIFSPAQTNYRLEVDGGGLLSPLSPYSDPWNSSVQPGSVNAGRAMSISQGDPAVVEGLSVDQWSMQSVQSEGALQDFGRLTYDLQLGADHLTGTLKNTTNHDFQDAFVILGTKFTHLGPLAPGQEAAVDLDLSGLGSPFFSNSLSYAMFEQDLNSSSVGIERRQAESRRSLIENIFERTPQNISLSSTGNSNNNNSQTPVFVGWIDHAPPNARIPGAEPGEQASAIVLTALSYKLPEDRLVSIPVGLISGKLISYPRDGGTCGMPGSNAVYLSRGEALFEFSLPSDATRLKLKDLKLGLWTDNAIFTSPKTELYDWNKSEWITLDGMSQGVNMIPNATGFVRPDGLVQVRLSSESAQSCFYVALGMEGSQP